MNATTKRRVIFWSVLFLGIVLRCIYFGQIPAGINQDEAMGAVDAFALSKYATDRYGVFMPVHFTAWIYSQMSVFQSYCMIPFIKIFGFNTVAVRSADVTCFLRIHCTYLSDCKKDM